MDMVGEIDMDGMVVVGDAAGLTLNTGLTVRGMDLAVASGVAAAAGIGSALDAKDTSKAGLAGYREQLFASFAGQDMKTYAKAPSFLEVERMYKDYGELIGNVLYGAFNLDTQPRQHLAKVAAVVGKITAEDQAARQRRICRGARTVKPLSIPERLARNRFDLDEDESHIEINQQIVKATGCGKAIVACCPAHVYSRGTGRVHFRRVCRLPGVRNLPGRCRAGRPEMALPARRLRRPIPRRLDSRPAAVHFRPPGSSYRRKRVRSSDPFFTEGFSMSLPDVVSREQWLEARRLQAPIRWERLHLPGHDRARASGAGGLGGAAGLGRPAPRRGPDVHQLTASAPD